MPRHSNYQINKLKENVLGQLAFLHANSQLSDAQFDEFQGQLQGRPRLSTLQAIQRELKGREAFFDETERFRRTQAVQEQAPQQRQDAYQELLEEHKALNNLYADYKFRTNEICTSTLEFNQEYAQSLPSKLIADIQKQKAIKIRLTYICRFSKVNSPTTFLTIHIYSNYEILTRSRDVQTEIDRLAIDAQRQIENIDSYQLSTIQALRVVVLSYKPLSAASYVPTPEWIAGRNAIVNIKNDDQRCFEWAILADIHRNDINAHKRNQTSQYRKWFNKELNFEGISFPVAVDAATFDLFEKLNPEISVNVYEADNETQEFNVVHSSSNRNRKHQVELLLVEDSEGNAHYTTILNLSRLLNKSWDGALYYCKTCLLHFNSKHKLDAHVASNRCGDYKLSIGQTPAANSYIEWGLKHLQRSLWQPVVIYAQIKTAEGTYQPTQVKLKAVFEGSILKKHTTTTEAPICELFETLSSWSEELMGITFKNVPMEALSPEQKHAHNSTKTCYICGCGFNQDRFKVKDHDHQTGKYIGAACRVCNLHRRVSNNSKIPIIVHDLATYGHGILTAIALQETNRRTDILCKSFDKYLALTWGCYKFIDSNNFLQIEPRNLKDLRDQFEAFRKCSYKTYQLDPCHYVSAPGLSWDAMLKFVKPKIELITDPEMYQMFESMIRGGLSVMNYRYAKPASEDEHIVYLDCNNLYGWALSQKLPVGDFRWEDAATYKIWDIENERGAILEVDLEYPQSLHQAHSDFPMILTKKQITEDMLSPYQQAALIGKKLSKEPHLIATLESQNNYILSLPLLQTMLTKGLVVKKVHRVISFEQADYMRPYIELNAQLRNSATNKFEKDFYKLMNNSLYGKTIENVKGRSTVKVAKTEKLFLKYARSPFLVAETRLSDDAVAFELLQKQVKLNKPIAVGAMCLELAKCHMFQFYYDGIKEVWPEAKLLMSDTDSFALFVKSKTLPNEFKRLDVDQVRLGAFKNEFLGKQIAEYVGLRPKCYCLKTAETEQMKLSGISRQAAEDLSFDNYKKCLFEGQTLDVDMSIKRTIDHQPTNVRLTKQALNTLDIKRYYEDAFRSFPYGYQKNY